ncbi:MAG: TetR/AcrR family transcriptional regulator [Rhodospirillaceae bacterium]|nr:TetR/AcrR family transcriptional regulator [Rhodospirillales bacterium]
MQKACSPRSTAKREAILDAAQACFLEHGYSSTSMDMVAAKATVSKATIYAHFQSKDELFGAIIRRRCDDHSEGLGAVTLAENLDARAALTAMASHLLTMLMNPEVIGIYRMVVAEAARHPDLAKAYYEEGPLRGKKRLSEILDTLTARGVLKVPDSWQAMDQFIGMLRAEYFNRALMGLPADDRASFDTTVTGAVDVMLKVYGA